MRYLVFCLALFGATVLFTGQYAAHAQDASAVFTRLQDKYDSLEGLRAEFTQTMASAYSDETVSSSGHLVLQGDKYRVETDGQVLVTNGTATYIYLPGEKQLLINDVVEDETSFSPSEFLLNYDERFTVSGIETVQLDGVRHFKLGLLPKAQDSFFKEATIWLRDRDTIITRLEVLDVNETRMTFVLKNVELNPTLDARTFNGIDVPEDVQIVDLRS